jgi:hypothetical protein
VSPVKYELGFYIPEDDILHSHCRENFRSYKPNRISSILCLVSYSLITLLFGAAWSQLTADKWNTGIKEADAITPEYDTNLHRSEKLKLHIQISLKKHSVVDLTKKYTGYFKIQGITS